MNEKVQWTKPKQNYMKIEIRKERKNEINDPYAINYITPIC